MIDLAGSDMRYDLRRIIQGGNLEFRVLVFGIQIDNNSAELCGLQHIYIYIKATNIQDGASSQR